jgi:L-amino acid N-acyltransferase YncA
MTRSRPARMEDVAAIARIYKHGIEDGIATFQNEPRSAADIEQMLSQRGDTFPTVVVERDGQIVAWAGAGAYRAPAWYAPIIEHSVYVDRPYRGTGVGRVALLALIDEAERRGFLKLVSRPVRSRSMRVGSRLLSSWGVLDPCPLSGGSRPRP